ncbi:thioredoxin family protein [Aeribacillus pallidus]|uniref:thioredoxin family protein n=1 Tax=Aeribacillus pallidus TaxID=33936 RepID=UPI003D224D66
MKKVVIFLVIIFALFGAIAFITKMQQQQLTEGNPYGKDDLDPATMEQLDDPNYQNIILPEELEAKLNNGEDITVYFYSPICPHCKETTPILMPLMDELGVDLVQYNLLEFEQGWNKYNIEYTPTIVHYENGQEVARTVGSNTEEYFENWFKEHVLN